MERQFSVKPDRTDRSKRITSGGGPLLPEISTWAEPFHLRLDRNFRKFWHNGKHPWPHWENWGFGFGGCRLTRGGHIWKFDCIKYHHFVHIHYCSIVLTFHIYDSSGFFSAPKVPRQAWIVTSIFNFCIIQSISLLCSSTYNRSVKLPREGWNRIPISRTV